MITISSLLFFIGAAVLLILVPGPDLIFAVTQGLTSGKKAGVMTAIGLSLGNVIHTLAAALGLSLILKTSAFAFTLFKILAAGYLLYLAYMSFKHRKDPIEWKQGKNQSGFQLLLKGFMMNVLNPKVALFFLTFLPQFVNYSYGSEALQLILLGVIFLVLSGLIFGLLAYFAGAFSEQLLSKPSFGIWSQTAGSAIFAALGIKLLFTKM
ncbi:Lysine exporter protein (LYSE/YGGA) [Paenibacillus algicola]|uniref:Lysine exporter protein (LYSE/YGGA) n=1 Tax=Paenibacillus algicola TaxID=2565926 RepID=A0A4P8XMC7_9BACL|nr:LysE family translocator [Paenibacillus algicola]QCT02830.1 Lysine exporter protein (LYSE/YGGA) [Paenibacillus algicola]